MFKRLEDWDWMIRSQLLTHTWEQTHMYIIFLKYVCVDLCMMMYVCMQVLMYRHPYSRHPWPMRFLPHAARQIQVHNDNFISLFNILNQSLHGWIGA